MNGGNCVDGFIYIYFEYDRGSVSFLPLLQGSFSIFAHCQGTPRHCGDAMLLPNDSVILQMTL